MTEIFRPPFFQPDSINGVPLAGALLYFYAAGTTTPITVYQDSGLITPHASPVVADASGIFPAIYVNTTTYKIVLQTSAGVTVKTYDNINATSSSNTVLDGTFTIQNTSDQTKQAVFNAGNITTGTIRTFSFPDATGTLALTSNITAINTASNDPFINFAIGVPSVAASALTVPFNGVDTSAFSATNIGYVNFRSATAGSGAIAQLTLSSAQSLVVPSGASLGSPNAIATTYALAAFNNAGSIIYGIINPLTLPLVDGIASTTLLSGTSTSAGVWYTTSALTSKAYTIIGYFTATEATAGTWATAPSAVQVATAPAVSNNFSRIVLGTPTASTSGTSIDFTGIAAAIAGGARRVVVNLRGVTTSAGSELILQIGDSGGVETSGYTGTSGRIASGNSATAATISNGFGTGYPGSSTCNGAWTITLENSPASWVGTFMGAMSGGNVLMASGSKSLSPGPLDRVRVTTAGGSDTFTAGEINITYE